MPALVTRVLRLPSNFCGRIPQSLGTVGRVSNRYLPRGQVGRRGFTLIELMVVILIITVFAGLAVPTAVSQLRDRKLQEAGRKIALMYRQARLRAVGRGAAVLVSFQNNAVSVYEAQLGVAPTGAPAGCAQLPVASCLQTDWNGTPSASRLVDAFTVATSGDFSTLALSMADNTGANVPTLQICFTPSGRSFSTQAAVSPSAFTPMSKAYLLTLTRPGLGRPRNVALLPNGTARLSAQ
jgi:prepilin-type N-terminal cleavage/methylation domain-containing protein